MTIHKPHSLEVTSDALSLFKILGNSNQRVQMYPSLDGCVRPSPSNTLVAFRNSLHHTHAHGDFLDAPDCGGARNAGLPGKNHIVVNS